MADDVDPTIQAILHRVKTEAGAGVSDYPQIGAIYIDTDQARWRCMALAHHAMNGEVLVVHERVSSGQVVATPVSQWLLPLRLATANNGGGGYVKRFTLLQAAVP